MKRRASRRSRSFEAELLDGHKGPAVLVPFDPARAWAVKPRLIPSAAYGLRPGFPVRGTFQGIAFTGWIGQRWGRRFLLVEPALQRQARVEVGERCAVRLSPAPGGFPLPERTGSTAPRRRSPRASR
jgi:hypothetical protein